MLGNGDGEVSGDGGLRPGRITEELLRDVMKKEDGVKEEEGKERVKVFVCGPPEMEKALVGGCSGRKGGILSRMGYSQDQIYKF